MVCVRASGAIGDRVSASVRGRRACGLRAFDGSRGWLYSLVRLRRALFVFVPCKHRLLYSDTRAFRMADDLVRFACLQAN